MKCVDGLGTLSLTCTVQHLNVMKILKNGIEVSQCLTFPEYPYTYCEHSSPQDGNAKTNLYNFSMTYTIETAKTDLLPGNWACQNGGENDPRTNMKISIFTCISKTPSFSDKQLNIFMNVSLIVVPLVAFCLTAIYRRQTADDHNTFCKKKFLLVCCHERKNQIHEENNVNTSCKEAIPLQNCTDVHKTWELPKKIRTVCGITFCLIMVVVYVVIATCISVITFDKDLKAGIFVVCLVTGTTIFSSFPVIWTSKKHNDYTSAKKTTKPNDEPTADLVPKIETPTADSSALLIADNH
ncbi:uncharacterized protein [Mytilus edulis]|uniref:uncharacterized protein n=1 Tax=Mytilus edulis TaxID=6550 RepID=UPI0039EFC9F5